MTEETNTIRRSELPEMTTVKSSNIYAIGYDVANKMMFVLFSKDSPVVYRYPHINVERYRFVMDAESVGRAFASSIKVYSNSQPELMHEKLTLVGDGVSVQESSP